MCSQSVYCKLWNIFILEIGTFRWQSFVVIHLFYIILKRHLKNYRIFLQLRDRPLLPKDLFNDFEEVGPREEAGVVLLEVLDEVVQDEESS